MKIKEIIGEYNIPQFSLLKFLKEITGNDISYYIARPAEEISDYELKLVKKHFVDGYPVEYITNKAYFYDREFYVDENVLIPRPETEFLVKYAIQVIQNEKIHCIADIGTGSGIIAITLKKMFPELKVYAIDISENALEIAEKNAKKHGTEIFFLHGSFIEPLKNYIEDVQMIISNPPYVESDFINDSLKYEPEIALYAGKDGQDFFRELIRSSEILKNKILLCETTVFNIDKTIELLESIGPTYKLKDFNETERFVITNYKNLYTA